MESTFPVVTVSDPALQNCFTQTELRRYRVQFDGAKSGSKPFLQRQELKEKSEKLGFQRKLSDADVAKLLEEFDTENVGGLTFEGFLRLQEAIDSGSSYFSPLSKPKKSSTGASKDFMRSPIYSTCHVVNDSEKMAYVDHINTYLADDPHVKPMLPISITGSDFVDKMKSGIALCKLVNVAVPDTIDVRAINIKPRLNAWEQNENITLCINSARAVGCQVSNIGTQEVSEGREHLVVALVAQIVKLHLLSFVSLNGAKELTATHSNGSDDEESEEQEEPEHQSAEQLLLRWMNHYLSKAEYKKEVRNFANDLRDGEAYTQLLAQLAPGICDLSPMEEEGQERAELMLQQADKIGCRKFLQAKDVVEANANLNLAFIANLFNSTREGISKPAEPPAPEPEPEPVETEPEEPKPVEAEPEVPEAVEEEVQETLGGGDEKVEAAQELEAEESKKAEEESAGKAEETEKPAEEVEEQEGEQEKVVLEEEEGEESGAVEMVEEAALEEKEEEREEEEKEQQMKEEERRREEEERRREEEERRSEQEAKQKEEKEKEEKRKMEQELLESKKKQEEEEERKKKSKSREEKQKQRKKKNEDDASALVDEERMYRLWINSLDVSRPVHRLYQDLQDGFTLLEVLDKVQPGCVQWSKAHRPSQEDTLGSFSASSSGGQAWRGVYKKLENCQQAVEVGRSLNLSLVGIGSNDIAAGNRKFILAFLWQLMRKYTLRELQQLRQDHELSDSDILDWAVEVVHEERRKKLKKGEKQQAIPESFKDRSLATGCFLLELIAAVEPRVVNWAVVQSGSTEEECVQNANYIISVARKLGCSTFLVVQDIVQVRPKVLLMLVASIMAFHLQRNTSKTPMLGSPNKISSIKSPPVLSSNVTPRTSTGSGTPGTRTPPSEGSVSNLAVSFKFEDLVRAAVKAEHGQSTSTREFKRGSEPVTGTTTPPAANGDTPPVHRFSNGLFGPTVGGSGCRKFTSKPITPK